MINVMIVGQKRLAEQLLKQCLLKDDVKVVAVSPPSLTDRLALLAVDSGIPITVHDKVLKQCQVPVGVDIILTAHAYCFITESARHMAKHGAVGYHPSLLPLYKGRNAIMDVLRASETITGGSLYQLDNDWDSGEVLLQGKVQVDCNDTASILWQDKLAPMGLKLFKEYLEYLK